MKRLKLTIFIALFSLYAGLAQTNDLGNRALWASINGAKDASLGDYQQHTGKVLVSWRMLPGDNTTTAPWPVIGTEGVTAIVMKDPVKANNIAANWQLNQATAIRDLILTDRQCGKDYDLQGREINPHSARGLIIINGFKVIRK